MPHPIISTPRPTPKLHSISRSFSHIVLAASVVVGCANGAQVPMTQASHPGELLFNGHTKPEVDCFSCHNGDATGAGSGPDLSEAVAKHSDAELTAIINDGPSFMPSFKEELTTEETQKIIAWLRIKFPKHARNHVCDDTTRAPTIRDPPKEGANMLCESMRSVAWVERHISRR